MNTSATTVASAATSPHVRRSSPIRRSVGVVTDPQSYRNIGYLLLGLPLGTISFTVLVSGLSVAISMVVVALLGVPMLLGMWYVARWLANVERTTANVLLDLQIAPAPVAAGHRGNLWMRLRSMSTDRKRLRELGFLMLRFPAGVATFTAAVTALAVPIVVALAPYSARYGSDRPFGTWSQSSRIEDMASSSWSWFLVPLGVVLLIGSFHLLNALSRACGRWAVASLESGSPWFVPREFDRCDDQRS
jgi:Putative sensor